MRALCREGFRRTLNVIKLSFLNQKSVIVSRGERERMSNTRPPKLAALLYSSEEKSGRFEARGWWWERHEKMIMRAVARAGTNLIQILDQNDRHGKIVHFNPFGKSIPTAGPIDGFKLPVLRFL